MMLAGLLTLKHNYFKKLKCVPPEEEEESSINIVKLKDCFPPVSQ